MFWKKTVDTKGAFTAKQSNCRNLKVANSANIFGTLDLRFAHFETIIKYY